MSSRNYIVFTIQAIVTIFGRSVEPLMSNLLSPLLKLLSSSNEELRGRCKDVLDLLIEGISGRGVYSLLKQLSEGISDSGTRGRIVCIESLGRVNRIGTKQLSICLPKIVGRLTQAINDSNLEVKGAAEKSLSQILESVRNPEIAQSRDALIKSLSNPYAYNDRALDLLY